MFTRMKTIQTFIFLLLITNFRRFSSQNDEIKESEQFYKNLNNLVKTKCFSRIRINLDQPCRKVDLMKKCTFKSCHVPRIETLDPEFTKNLVCRFGIEENNQCKYFDPSDKNLSFVDLNVAKQTFTNYHKGAFDIWEAIYKEIEDNTNLYRLISGIHYSIFVHISFFYKSVGPGYLSNPIYYLKKKNSAHFKNLIFAENFVKGVVGRLQINHFRCSLEMEDQHVDQLSDIVAYLRSHRNIKFNDNLSLSELNTLENKIFEAINCIECEKCKLWGLIQFRGLFIAIKLQTTQNSSCLPGDELIYLTHLLHKLTSSISYVKIMEKYKYPLVDFFKYYSIEISTIIISLTVFFTFNKFNKHLDIKRKPVNKDQ
ncbi:hypothetical protein EDEG_01621 [Edhazardia aedis USNM 41457]|uniref:Endoplasmic oxidoreductin 1 n=1 Tax=Edhazardia aedis (strain USNM 41457) TaxID=1003232 RepID=J9D9D9_EDHAE|nr:hypothetical protein EDEG_01621 [Edhazardia aedis USNM 41457]|eukprot:EJW04099.2 hypothetical protein EDEG_01621 [Edhazardia aedis USNM 41457]